MVKLVNKFGLGLALGALAGHYLSTEKGQVRLAQLKDEVLRLTENPKVYKENLVSRAKGVIVEQLQAAYDNKEDIMAAFGQVSMEEEGSDLSAETADIIITYAEDEVEVHTAEN